MIAYGICFSLSYLLHLVLESLAESCCCNGIFVTFYCRVVFHCVNVSYLLLLLPPPVFFPSPYFSRTMLFPPLIYPWSIFLVLLSFRPHTFLPIVGLGPRWVLGHLHTCDHTLGLRLQAGSWEVMGDRLWDGSLDFLLVWVLGVHSDTPQLGLSFPLCRMEKVAPLSPQHGD